MCVCVCARVCVCACVHIPASGSSAQVVQYTRIVEIPALGSALAGSAHEQQRLELRRTNEGPEALDRRAPDVLVVETDPRTLGPADAALFETNVVAAREHEGCPRKRLRRVPTNPPRDVLNENDGLHAGALTFVLSAPTVGCTNVSNKPTNDGLSVRLCSLPFLCRFFRARLQHVVLQLQTTRPVALAASAFLRGCAPLGEQLIARGVLDYRIDGFLESLRDAGDDSPYRVARVNVGGACYARWPRRDVCVSDTLLLALVADVFDPEHPSVAGAPPLAAWLARDASDIAYEPEEHAAYVEAREAMLGPSTDNDENAPPAAPAMVPAATPAGTALRATNLRLVPTTSTFLWAAGGRDAKPTRSRSLRRKLGLRAAVADGGGAAQELVIGYWPVARVMETDVSWDQLLKVQMGCCAFEEADGAPYERGA